MEDIGREGCECRSDHRAAGGFERLRWLGQRRGAALPSELEQKSSKREFWLLRVVVVVGREGFALFATLAGLAGGMRPGRGLMGRSLKGRSLFLADICLQGWERQADQPGRWFAWVLHPAPYPRSAQ